jgi:hypothetical protein
MSDRTATIQVSPETAALLSARARVQGLSEEEYLRSLLLNGNAKEPTRERHFQETATPEEWIAALDEWVKSHDPNTPGLSIEDVSRETIYEDR